MLAGGPGPVKHPQLRRLDHARGPLDRGRAQGGRVVVHEASSSSMTPGAGLPPGGHRRAPRSAGNATPGGPGAELPVTRWNLVPCQAGISLGARDLAARLRTKRAAHHDRRSGGSRPCGQHARRLRTRLTARAAGRKLPVVRPSAAKQAGQRTLPVYVTGLDLPWGGHDPGKCATFRNQQTGERDAPDVHRQGPGVQPDRVAYGVPDRPGQLGRAGMGLLPTRRPLPRWTSRTGRRRWRSLTG